MIIIPQGPNIRRFDAPPLERHTVDQWIAKLGVDGPDGGMRCAVIQRTQDMLDLVDDSEMFHECEKYSSPLPLHRRQLAYGLPLVVDEGLADFLKDVIGQGRRMEAATLRKTFAA